MSSIKSFNMIRLSHLIVLCLIILIEITATQSVTINPNQDKDEDTTTQNSKNWKPSLFRNNKEIKLIPTFATEEKENTSQSTAGKNTRHSIKSNVGNERSLKSDSFSNNNPLLRTNEFGQRKQQNIENTSTKRINLLKTNTKPIVHQHKESNKIEIKLLAQDETLETTTTPYRRRYRKNRNKHQNNRNHEKQEENEEDGEKHTNDKRMINDNQNKNEETTTTNRLFSKNKRRQFGNRYNNRINKESTKVNEKTTELPNEENYKISLNVDKRVNNDSYDIKENNDTYKNNSTNKNDDMSIEEHIEPEKSKEKTNKLIEKYKIPNTSPIETPIEIITTHKDLLNNHYYPDTNYYNKNTLTNFQLLSSLGMRKVRQPNSNHQYKRHQYQHETKSRSQYNNMNSDSQMYVVKLPPQPYYFVNDKSSYNIMKPKSNLPITFNNNGKIDKVYHYNLPLVEKLMTGRKTYGNNNNKLQYIHDNQYNIGPYKLKKNDHNDKQYHNEYRKHNKNNTRNNETNLKYESSNNEYKKFIPVHEENTSSEENTDKSFDLNYKKFNPFDDDNDYKRINTFNDDYKSFNPTYEYNKFNEKELYDKFNSQNEYNKFNVNDDFKLFDPSYEFNKFKSDEFVTDKDRFKFNSPSKGSIKHGLYDSNVFNIKPLQSSFSDKRLPLFNSDKYFRTYDRLDQSSSSSPIYMKPHVHRYYTNNGKPKSIYVLPKYSKT